MRLKVYLVVFWVFNFLCAQDPIKKGRILDSLPILGSADESYSVYLPQSFDKNEHSPIIFVFEPRARAKMGILPFTEAADNYGIIIVSSNDSKNGPFEQNFKTAENLFATIFQKYKIDRDNIFLAGFSGGSRLATAIAVMTNEFTGVIACGAGFSPSPLHIPSTQDFLYVGLCGNKDMNLREMLVNRSFLGKLDFKNTLFSFEGRHEWPKQKEITRAIDWLFLQQRIKNNTIKPNMLVKLFEKQKLQTQRFEQNNQLLFAIENYERILETYQGLINTDSLKTVYHKLLKSKNYKAREKSFTKALTIELKLVEKFVEKFDTCFNKPKNTELSWWKKEAQKLKEQYVNGNIEMRNMIERITFTIFAVAHERKNNPVFQTSSEQVAFCNKIINIFTKKY
ncbi:MAG: hypothetical protein AAGB24_00025 [Bacteroidota bacterium]